VTVEARAGTGDDPDDTRGRLDIAQASLTSWDGPFSPPRFRFEATMFNRWTCRQAHPFLEDACVITFYLDTKGRDFWGQSGWDYRMHWHPGFCGVLERDGPSEQLIARGIADKTRRSALCSIRRTKLDIDKKLRWFVVTTWANRDHGWYATDHAPDRGWYG
jgi:hypothetical protein